MGEIIATCGHKVEGDDAFKGHYWLQLGRECQLEINYGNLCPKCIPCYRAVEANSCEESEQLLKGNRPIEVEERVKEINGILGRIKEVK